MKKMKYFIVNSGIGFAVETFIAPMKNTLGQLASVANEAGNYFGDAIDMAIDYVIDNFFNFKK